MVDVYRSDWARCDTRTGRVALLLLSVGAMGCVTPTRDRAWVDAALRERVGRGLSAGGEAPWPDDVALEDGVDEDEVGAIALWRSPAYRAELTRLDAARANVEEASRPANPQLTLLGSLGPVTAIATLLAPLESLWQLPQRTAAASRELESIAESLVMTGLDLVRDARIAHIELGLSLDRAQLRDELERVTAEVARIAEVHARVGDAPTLEAQIMVAEAAVATDAKDSAHTELTLSRARLGTLLALDEITRAGGVRTEELAPVFAARRECTVLDVGSLLRAARISRPDVRAAELSLEAASARAGWEEARVIAVAAQVEGQWNRATVPSLRLGGRIELPIFGLNPGGIGRADAEVVRAAAQIDVVIRRAALEVVTAYQRADQASRSFALYRATVVPQLDAAAALATSTYETGEETYLVVLDALRRRIEARVREAELLAESRRSCAELERAVGARLRVHVAATRSE